MTWLWVDHSKVQAQCRVQSLTKSRLGPGQVDWQSESTEQWKVLSCMWPSNDRPDTQTAALEEHPVCEDRT